VNAKSPRRIVGSLLGLALIAALAGPAEGGADPAGLPALPETPVAPLAIVAAKRFAVDVPFALRAGFGRPTVRTGWIVVLDVDPAIGVPRQLASPVLYVGDRVAVYGARPGRSGRIVALVPGDVDLAVSPIWFGTPELPERVDAATIARERELAIAAGIRAPSEDELRRAREAGGPEVRLADESAVEAAARALLDPGGD